MELRDRIKEFRRVKASTLLPHPKNWRQHPAAQADALRGILAEVGWVDALLVRETPAGLQIIDGHLRAKLDPDAEVPVLVLDLADAEADKILATFDPLTTMAETDSVALDALLRDVESQTDAVRAMLAALASKPPKTEEEAEFKSEFSVLIRCDSEAEQREVITELDRHNLNIKALVVDFPVRTAAEAAELPPIAEGEIEIVRSCKIKRSPRVIQLEGLFDVPRASKAEERWRLTVKLDRPWEIGLIVGPSGSGKTTVAQELFGDNLVAGWEWPADRALVDAFPKELAIAEVTGLLSSVGFSSPPAWLKPFRVLSNGEQFRCALARTLAERPALAVIDEFTSVVDRTVAKVGSAAVAKAIRSSGRRLVAVACHFDIEAWLQPDWKIEMPAGKLTWRSLRRRPALSLSIRRCSSGTWEQFRRHHYLDHGIHPGSQCFVGSIDGQVAAFTAVLHTPHAKGGFFREHRTVCLPDFQGVGIGNAMSELVGSVMLMTGKAYRSTTSHPAMIRHRLRSPLWHCVRKPSLAPAKVARAKVSAAMNASRAAYRLTASFEFMGEPRADAARLLGIS